MKYLALWVSTIMSVLSCAHAACVLPLQTVPFQLSIPAGCSVPANYNFGIHFIIFCYGINPSIPGNISWPYKGIIQQGTLPIQLKTNSNYQGSFADKQGTLQITNTQASALTYSCAFAF